MVRDVCCCVLIECAFHVEWLSGADFLRGLYSFFIFLFANLLLFFKSVLKELFYCAGEQLASGADGMSGLLCWLWYRYLCHYAKIFCFTFFFSRRWVNYLEVAFGRNGSNVESSKEFIVSSFISKLSLHSWVRFFVLQILYWPEFKRPSIAIILSSSMLGWNVNSVEKYFECVKREMTTPKCQGNVTWQYGSWGLL